MPRILTGTPMSRTSLPRLLALALLLPLASGCAPLKPWERGNLAKPHMALTTNAGQAAMRTHMEISREAASGGDTASGGGCGCN